MGVHRFVLEASGVTIRAIWKTEGVASFIISTEKEKNAKDNSALVRISS